MLPSTAAKKHLRGRRTRPRSGIEFCVVLQVGTAPSLGTIKGEERKKFPFGEIKGLGFWLILDRYRIYKSKRRENIGINSIRPHFLAPPSLFALLKGFRFTLYSNWKECQERQIERQIDLERKTNFTFIAHLKTSRRQFSNGEGALLCFPI